jgi:hypothetical protein
VSLCKDILSIDETLSNSLHPTRYAFVADGLGQFLAYYLVKDLVHVKVTLLSLHGAPCVPYPRPATHYHHPYCR